MNLILFDAAEVRGDGSVSVADERAAHMRTILRVAPDQQVRIGLIDGPFGIGTVSEVTDAGVTLRCVFESTTTERPRVDILLALPRPKAMRRLWAQLSAMGVGQVLLTNAEKVERDYFDTHLLRPDGYRPLLIEGLQQARDTRLPQVSIHKQFRKLIETDLNVLFPDGHRIVADPAGTSSMADALRAHRGRVLIAIGPEGGWNAFEFSLLQSQGFIPLSMGARTLTTTTACIALLALAHAQT